MINNSSNMIIYTTTDGLTKVDVTFDEDTVWLTQDQMAELFQKSKSTINEHIKNIYVDGELQKESTMRKFGNPEFSTKPTNYYNLDMIISVGYRVRSQRGVQFRIWASGVLKEYMKKGFTLDDERLKKLGGGGYFKELLERIRVERILTMSGEQLLIGNGSITHKQAVDKATDEYKKYKAKTLSDVEEDYLNSIRLLEKKTEV